MSYIGSNLLAIVGATVVGLLIGAVFSWLDTNRSESRRHGREALLLAVVSEFWLAAILAGALILAPVQADAWTIAIGTAVVIWIGFVLPVLLTSYPFRALGWRALLTDSLHWLLVMTAQAAVLHLIGLSKP